jgi:hypothetical protein
MASTLQLKEARVIAGKYKAKADFQEEENSQLSVRQGEILLIQDQSEDRGWVWAQKTNKTGPKTEGYVPRNYLEKVPEGDWDQWAYGSEIISCFYAMFSGCFILLYGSATKTDPTIELAIGTFAMMLASFLMIIIFFRNLINPVYRAIYLAITAIVLFAGFPMGAWGGITLIFAMCIEILVWYSQDDPYTPDSFSLAGCCRSIFAATLFNMFIFLLWLASNGGIFIWGLEYGKDRADEWNNPENAEMYLIPSDSWSFAQAMAQCICFQITCLLIFSLQGFQQILITAFNFETARQGKAAKFKAALMKGLGRESMLSVHKFISFTMLFCASFHVLGCFSAYEHSGPEKDFNKLFGEGPILTGGLLIILLAIILSSTYLSPERRPTTFRYVHLVSVLFLGVLVLHGKSFFAPNMYKWLIAPFILFSLDKAFRIGVFGYQQADEEEQGRHPPQQ